MRTGYHCISVSTLYTPNSARPEYMTFTLDQKYNNYHVQPPGETHKDMC
jgi:hypothetical protein